MREGRWRIVAGLVGALALFVAVHALAAGHGSVDKSFGRKGVQRIHLSGGYDEVNSVAVGPGGRIVLAGYYGEFDKAAVVVLKPNGGFDHTFSRDGVKLIKFRGGEQADAESVAVDRRGRIVVMGDRGAFGADTPGDQKWDFAVARLRPNGTFDRTFGHHGRKLMGFKRGDTYIGGGALSRDGRIALVGDTEGRHRDLAAVAVLNRHGRPDRAFSHDGKLAFTFRPKAGRSDSANANTVAFDRHGSVVVAGGEDGSGPPLGVARLTRSGHFDHRFSGNGRTTLSAPFRYPYLTSLLLDHRGRISLGITGTIDNATHAAIARLRSHGNLDHSFSGNGLAVPPLSDPVGVYGMARDQRGRIIGASCAPGGSSSHYSFSAFRLRSGGGIDRTFGDHGLSRVALGGRRSCAFAVTLDHNHRILLAGEAKHQHQDTDFAAARLKP